MKVNGMFPCFQFGVVCPISLVFPYIIVSRGKTWAGLLGAAECTTKQSSPVDLAEETGPGRWSG